MVVHSRVRCRAEPVLFQNSAWQEPLLVQGFGSRMVQQLGRSASRCPATNDGGVPRLRCRQLCGDRWLNMIAASLREWLASWGLWSSCSSASPAGSTSASAQSTSTCGRRTGSSVSSLGRNGYGSPMISVVDSRCSGRAVAHGRMGPKISPSRSRDASRA